MSEEPARLSAEEEAFDRWWATARQITQGRFWDAFLAGWHARDAEIERLTEENDRLAKDINWIMATCEMHGTDSADAAKAEIWERCNASQNRAAMEGGDMMSDTGHKPNPIEAENLESVRRRADSFFRVIQAVFAERGEQDQQWGGPEHDDQRAYFDWLAFIALQTTRAQKALNIGDTGFAADLPEYRRRLVKIAALAVAAMESFDRHRARAALEAQP